MLELPVSECSTLSKLTIFEFRAGLGSTGIIVRLWHEEGSNSKLSFSKSGYLMRRQVASGPLHSAYIVLWPAQSLKTLAWIWRKGRWEVISVSWRTVKIHFQPQHWTRPRAWHKTGKLKGDCFQRQQYRVVNHIRHLMILVIDWNEMCKRQTVA